MMIKKIKFPLAIKENNLLISVFIATTLALSLACTPARQMAQQRTEPVSLPTRLEADNNTTEKALLTQPSADESLTETNSPMEIWEQPLTPQVAEEKTPPPPFRKQRFSPAAPKAATLAEEESPQNIDDFMGTPTVKRVQMEQQIDETATDIREKYVENLTPNATSSTARMDHDKTNEKIEEVLIQLVAQHETMIQLMEQQMNENKLTTARHTAHEPISTEQPEESFSPDFAQKTVMEEADTDGIVKVSISAGRSVLIDEKVLIAWEEAVEAMERGEIPRIKLPAWILQGLEWLTHAPAQEPVRSQTIMPLYRHMKYAGHLSQVNMNSMTPAEVVATLRIFVNEMKQKKGQIRKA